LFDVIDPELVLRGIYYSKKMNSLKEKWNDLNSIKI
jgi:hypothetical protein